MKRRNAQIFSQGEIRLAKGVRAVFQMLTRAQCRFKRRQIHVASFVAGGSHLAAHSFDKVFATQATRIRRRGCGPRGPLDELAALGVAKSGSGVARFGEIRQTSSENVHWKCPNT